MAYDWENKSIAEKKAKLEELKAKLAQAKASADYSAQRRGLQGAAEALMPYDPMGAFNLMDKREALDIKWKQAEKDGKTDPADVRYKLVSALNALNGRIANTSSSDPSLSRMNDLAKRMEDEISSDTPSIQNAYTMVAKAKTFVDPNSVTPPPSASPTNGNLPAGVTLSSETMQALRNGKVSDVATDWYERKVEDGYTKPVLFAGLDIQNSPASVKSAYNEELDKWRKNNNSAKAESSNKAAGTKGSDIAKRYYTKSAAAVSGLRDMATQLNSLIARYHGGNGIKPSYDLANFADLKSTMADGRMTDSDVGLALGLTASEGMWQNALSFLTNGKAGVAKLGDKEMARQGINRTIDAYNAARQAIANPPFSGPYKDAAKKAWEDNSYSTDFAALPSGFSKIPSGNADVDAGKPLLNVGKETPPPKDQWKTDKKGKKYWVNSKNERVYE